NKITKDGIKLVLLARLIPILLPALCFSGTLSWIQVLCFLIRQSLQRLSLLPKLHKPVPVAIRLPHSYPQYFSSPSGRSPSHIIPRSATAMSKPTSTSLPSLLCSQHAPRTNLLFEAPVGFRW